MKRLFLLLPFLLLAGHVEGQAYPTKPVRIILTNPPGGTVDVLARTLSDELAKSFGQPFVIENRPGANGTLGGQALMAADADAHALMLGPPGPIAINKLMYAMPYDPQKAFAPVSLVAIAPLVLVVNPALPVKSLQEFIEYAKANPGKISYASQSSGSSGHLAMELLKARTGIYAVHIPYRGSGPAIADLVAGQTHAMFDNTTSALPQVRSGRLRAIAVAEKARLKAEPTIPTVAESGVPGFEATPWFGVVVKAGSPKSAIDSLSAAIGRIVKQPHVEARFAPLGVELVGSTPEQFAAHIDAEIAKWDAVVKRSGAKLD
ncbi:MAG TPA: tripartite tricarboxylate transporter substrate binding protein [Burkholderiales bacterium]|nr:tripartite tricarboxylate transporter substrate binding protein [Burkholderiales bacterium]